MRLASKITRPVNPEKIAPPTRWAIKRLTYSKLRADGGELVPAPHTAPVWQWRGTPAEFAKDCAAIFKTPRGKDIHTVLATSLRTEADWYGFNPDLLEKESIENLITGFSPSMLDLFQKNLARLTPDHYQLGRPELAKIGASFSIGRVLQGHPVAAYRRARAKLPPKSVEVTISASANRTAADISAAITRIARALWDYHLAGGAVTFTAHFCSEFHQPRRDDDTQASVVTMQLPIGNVAALASIASVAFYRAVALRIVRNALAPDPERPCLPIHLIGPNIFKIDGRPETTERVLAALRIQ